MRIVSRTRLRAWLAKRTIRKSLPENLRKQLTLVQLQQENLSRQQMYGYCDHYFDEYLPLPLRRHREYFSTDGRGFGENAFHAMWYLLFDHIRPKSVLEIGVFRGQTVTLMQLLARHFGIACHVGCISPFTSFLDSVSNYQQNVDYFEDTTKNHEHFGLPLPEICREFSTSETAKKFIHSRPWDVIYIDGNHEYEVAKSDWEASAESIAPNGVIVLDDSALYTDFRPPAVIATAGYPGSSRVAEEIDPKEFREIIGVGHNRAFQRIGPS